MKYSIRTIEPQDNKALSRIIKTSLEDLGYAIPGTVYTDEATNHLYDGFQSELLYKAPPQYLPQQQIK